MSVAGAIDAAFVSPNEMDSNFEPANVVDGLFALARAIDRVADAIVVLDSNLHRREF